MMKKTLSLILALAMILSMAGAVFAEGETTPAQPAATETTPATEVAPAATEETPAATATEMDPKVQWVIDQKWVEGYGDGDYKLASNITRAEFTKVLVAGLGMKEDAERSVGIGINYNDMKGHWATGYVAVAQGMGLVKGYPDGTFRPNANITNAEIITMLVRAIKAITPQEELTAIWPSTYVVKASVNGILQDIKFTEGQFAEPALRETVFKMIYNAANNANLKAFGNHSVVKAIVLQNDRLRSDLKENEVNVEFMKVLQESDYVKNSRAEGKDIVGKQKAFVIDKKIADVENILGRVVDLTIDKAGNVIEVKIDEKYVQKVEAFDKVDRDEINGYTVNFNERYISDDERIFATYNNDKDYKFDEFQRRVNDGTIKPSAVRITLSDTKNVLFIESYDFNDVAPVQKVDGKQVYYYNDMRDGSIDRFTVGSYVITYSEKYGFGRGTAESITADDVVHTYGTMSKPSVIVRTDADFTGKLVKTVADKYGEYAVIDAKLDKNLEPEISTVNFHRGVYTYEKKVYKTINGRQDLEPIVGEEAKFLISMHDELQLVDSDVAVWGGIFGIKSIRSAGGVRFMPAQGDDVDAYETFKTNYFIKGTSLNNALLRDFDIDDVVYSKVEANGETDKIRSADVNVIKHMYLLADETVYATQFSPATLTDRYLTVKGVPYRFDNLDTQAFSYKDGRLRQFSMKEAVKNNKKNADLEAYVLTEDDVFNALDSNVDLYNFLSRDPEYRKGFARVVIFKNAKGDKADVVYRYAQVEELYNWTNEIKVLYSNESNYKNAKGDVIRTQVLKLDDLKGPAVNSIVELEIDEASLEEKDGKAPLVVAYTQVIAPGQATERILDGGMKEKSVEFEKLGKLYRSEDTETFGDSRWNYAQVYQSDDDKPQYFTIARYFKDPKGYMAPSSFFTNINAKDDVVVVDKDLFYYVDKFTTFYKYDAKGNKYTAAVGTSILDTLTAPQEIKELKYVKIDGRRFIESVVLVDPKDPAEVKAQEYRDSYSEVYNMPLDKVTTASKDAINKAVAAYDALPANVKALLKDEKAKLDKVVEALNKAIAAEEAANAKKDADKFIADNKAILDKAVADVVEADKAAIEKALADYAKLSDAAKALLTAEKKDLDSKLAKATPAPAFEFFYEISSIGLPIGDGHQLVISWTDAAVDKAKFGADRKATVKVNGNEFIGTVSKTSMRLVVAPDAPGANFKSLIGTNPTIEVQYDGTFFEVKPAK